MFPKFSKIQQIRKWSKVIMNFQYNHHVQYYPISLQQHFLMFFSSNLDETGFQRTVSEIADQEDSKTPPGNLIWSEIEWVIEALKSCSLIFSSTRSRQGFCGNQLLHQILVNFGFQGVFQNLLDEQILKLTLVSQFHQDLVEKNCCCKLIGYYCSLITF